MNTFANHGNKQESYKVVSIYVGQRSDLIIRKYSQVLLRICALKHAWMYHWDWYVYKDNLKELGELQFFFYFQTA